MIPKVRCTIQGWSKSLQACCHCPAQRCDTLHNGGNYWRNRTQGIFPNSSTKINMIYSCIYDNDNSFYTNTDGTAHQVGGHCWKNCRFMLFPVRLSRSTESTANVSVRTWAHLHRVDEVMPSRCVTNEQIRLRLRPAEQFQKPLTKVHKSIKNENMYRTTSGQIFSLSTSSASLSWGQTTPQRENTPRCWLALSQSLTQPSQPSHEDLHIPESTYYSHTHTFIYLYTNRKLT